MVTGLNSDSTNHACTDLLRIACTVRGESPLAIPGAQTYVLGLSMAKYEQCASLVHFRTLRCSSSVLSAAAGAVHEHGTFTFVLSHGGGAGELRPRFGSTAELLEQAAAHAGQQVIAL